MLLDGLVPGRCGVTTPGGHAIRAPSVAVVFSGARGPLAMVAAEKDVSGWGVLLDAPEKDVDNKILGTSLTFERLLAAGARMPVGGLAGKREVRGLGIVLLILSLVHTPLPQPDFHNIRHHDAAGEICEHHDHLLRWHPGAGQAQDVAILHWHWFLPAPGPTEAQEPGDGPALHAHIADWFASSWDTAPRLAPDDHSRLIVRPGSRLLGISPADLAGVGLTLPPALGPCRSYALGAPLAPRASLTSLLQRWLC